MKGGERVILEALARLRRPASVAQVGGFRPPDDPRASWFAGPGVGLPGETHPEFEGRQMLPLIQINVAELPHVPQALADVALLILFLDGERLPFDRPHGEGWCVREYRSQEGLVPLPAPTRPPLARSLPIRWSPVENDVPGWEDFWNLVDFDPAARDFASFPYPYENHPGTKVGGFPTPVQHEVGVEHFVFQVDSEAKARWQWVDQGIAYFFKPADQSWCFSCQFL